MFTDAGCVRLILLLIDIRIFLFFLSKLFLRAFTSTAHCWPNGSYNQLRSTSNMPREDKPFVPKAWQGALCLRCVPGEKVYIAGSPPKGVDRRSWQAWLYFPPRMQGARWPLATFSEEGTVQHKKKAQGEQSRKFETATVRHAICVDLTVVERK